MMEEAQIHGIKATTNKCPDILLAHIKQNEVCNLQDYFNIICYASIV